MTIFEYPSKFVTTKLDENYILNGHQNDVEIAVEMADFVLNTAGCQSLSAPQVGVMRRFFVVKENMISIRYYFDPKIVGHGRELEFKNEKCLSVPNACVICPRWRIIDVEYYDEQGILRTRTLRSLEARAFQHELDHLNGLLIIKTDNDRERELCETPV